MPTCGPRPCALDAQSRAALTVGQSSGCVVHRGHPGWRQIDDGPINATSSAVAAARARFAACWYLKHLQATWPTWTRRPTRPVPCGGSDQRFECTEVVMLWTIAAILVVLWIVGLASAYTMGGLIHILLVVAVVMVVFNLISGRRALR